jgi:predicted metalloprotease with PDZ domain
VPNSLNLEGDYDWFYEGFTLYTALRTALELKAIDFKEFLNTLSRVYDSYRTHPDMFSLIDESERRWAGSGSTVYVKGMLVAFLYDLMIRRESGGQKTLADRYRDLFNGHVADGANGNDVIISVLSSPPAVSHFTKSYVETSGQLELERILPAYGLAIESTARGSQLRVGRGLNEEQKRLLQSLGYRN